MVSIAVSLIWVAARAGALYVDKQVRVMDQSKQAMLVTRRADSVTRSFIHILACMEVGFPARPAGWPIDQYQLAELTCWQQCKLHLGLDPSLPLHSSDPSPSSLSFSINVF